MNGATIPETEEKKGFLARLLEKADKNLEKKSKKKSCCCCDSEKDKDCCE